MTPTLDDKHTIGPWHLRPDPDDSDGWVIVDGTHGHFQVCSIEPRFVEEEELANARLIESAPSLLARIKVLEAALARAKELAYRPFPKPFAIESYTPFYVEWCADRERIFGSAPNDAAEPSGGEL